MADLNDRDVRYYANDNKTHWIIRHLLVSALRLVDAHGRTTQYTRFPNRENHGQANVKDSLSGKKKSSATRLLETTGRKMQPKETVMPTLEQRWRDTLFTARDPKWRRESDQAPMVCETKCYLRDRLGLDAEEFRRGMGFDSVQDVADRNKNRGSYVAVLAMDGDEMGKWVSGDKAPLFLDQLSEPARKVLEPILVEHGCADLRRQLSPSYHLQFSEALANFATWLARPIVEAFGGQLVYAGGDDVLAMLPADQAIGCARALRTVFRGEAPENMTSMPLNIEAPGFVTAGAGYPLMVPGQATDARSAAIGHEKRQPDAGERGANRQPSQA